MPAHPLNRNNVILRDWVRASGLQYMWILSFLFYTCLVGVLGWRLRTHVCSTSGTAGQAAELTR